MAWARLAPMCLLAFACSKASGPQLTSVSPKNGAATGGVTVELKGTGFAPGATVLFGGAAATQTQFISANDILVVTPPGTGTVDVTVDNPNGKAARLSGGFSFVSHAPLRPGCRVFSQQRPAGCPAVPATFSFDANAAGQANAQQVQLAGEFTGWQSSPIPMQKNGSVWTTSVPLRPGAHEYKYIVDGTWLADPAAPTEPIFGNSVKVVTDACLPKVSLTTPAMGTKFGTASVHLSGMVQPGHATDGTPRTLDGQGVVLCVNDVEYPLQPDASGHVSTDLTLSDGRYRLSLQAQDSGGFTSPQSWTYFNVSTQNQPPVANPGPALFVRAGTQVILDGANSFDPNGDDLTTFNWSTVDATVSFDASQLPDGRVSPAEGYRKDPSQDDPNALPPITHARKLYTPTQPGVSTVKLDVADAHGTSTNTNNQMQVVSLPTSGPRPRVQLALDAPAFGPVVIDGSASQRAPMAQFRWLADAKNPTAFDLTPYLKNNGARLELPRSALGEGVWRYYVWIEDSGGASWPGGAQVLVKDGVYRVDDFFLAPKWASEGAMYEIFVRRFNDSDGDGIGDLKGVTQKLDYLAGLGVKTLWLMPIFASNDHDHGYHAVDYYDIEADYGTRDDLEELLREAHKRGLKVILDLAINHTSRRHPLFSQSLNAFMDPNSAGAWFRDWYIWFDNSSTSLVDKYGWGRELGSTRLTLDTGWAEIPDVDFGHPEARHYIFEMAKYWLDPNGDGDFSDGVDGYRLDHVTGPDHSVWASFRSEIKALNPDALLIGEVFRGFTGNGYSIADYYHGELDAAFTFPIYFQFDAMWRSNADPRGLHDIVSQLQSDLFPIGSLHVSFLENHDVPNPPVFAKYGPDKLKVGLVLEAAMPPVPQAIWGQELGLAEYRGFSPWSKEGPDNDLENHFRAVMTARRDEPALRSGSFAWAGTNAEGQAVAIVRQAAGSPTVIAVVNDGATALSSLDVDLSQAGDGTTLKPIVGTVQATIDTQRHMHLSLPAWGSAMYELTK